MKTCKDCKHIFVCKSFADFVDFKTIFEQRNQNVRLPDPTVLAESCNQYLPVLPTEQAH